MADNDVSPFQMPKISMGYPLDKDERMALKRNTQVVTRDELFFVLDDFTGASTASIESLKDLLDRTVFG